VTNGFAAERDVILVDYPGIGGSSGETPSTVAPLTKACVEFCRALELTRFDVLGFSLGGMIAQQLAADHPEMVRRIDRTARRRRDGLRGTLGRRTGGRSRLDHERVLYAKRAE
jgi:pimeloyl-ACP methyl ester carboxylesterase